MGESLISMTLLPAVGSILLGSFARAALARAAAKMDEADEAFGRLRPEHKRSCEVCAFSASTFCVGLCAVVGAFAAGFLRSNNEVGGFGTPLLVSAELRLASNAASLRCCSITSFSFREIPRSLDIFAGFVDGKFSSFSNKAHHIQY